MPEPDAEKNAGGGQSGSDTYQGQTWWVVTNLDPDPCCNAPCVATNGEDAICQTCGWETDYDDLQRYLDSDGDANGGAGS